MSMFVTTGKHSHGYLSKGGRYRFFLPLAAWFLSTPSLGDSSDALLPSFHARATEETPQRPSGVPSDEELIAARARIGEIRIDTRNIFDTRKPEEDKALPRLANRLHVRTRHPTIGSQLLFRPG